MASAPLSQRQKIDLAMLMLIKSKRFQVDICAWNATNPAHKTWDNFQDDFRSAYDSIRDLGDLAIDQSPVLNQAQLMESIMHAMQEAGRISPLPEQNGTGPPRYCLPIAEEPAPVHTEQANSAFETRLLAKFEALNAEIATLHRDCDGDRDTNRRRSRSTTGRTPKRYCWSCGCCPHWGRNCESKKTGHKDDASFTSRKGGSNENCRPNT